MMSNNMSDDDANNNEDKEMEADVFFRDARDIMNQMSQKVGTDANWADIFTKPLGKVKFQRLRHLLMGW